MKTEDSFKDLNRPTNIYTSTQGETGNNFTEEQMSPYLHISNKKQDTVESDYGAKPFMNRSTSGGFFKTVQKESSQRFSMMRQRNGPAETRNLKLVDRS